jgi:hypothetical protein
MPKYSKEHEKEFMGNIRQVLVYNSNISILAIQKILVSNSINLNKDYINKLLRNIRGERAHRYNNEAQQEAIAKFEDLKNEMNKMLFNIISNPDNQKIKIIAIRQLYNQNKELLMLQLENGIFEGSDRRKDVIWSVTDVLKVIHDTKQLELRQKNKLILP